MKSISGGGAASSVLNFSTGAGLGATGVALVQGAKKGLKWVDLVDLGELLLVP
ncbi:hypothetical protein [Lysinibacillus sphaericus]|uniref:hypothetical protein n=1 Tax=Lysinibacillus sphaericus TaxID=1421 RepID=UPI000A7E9F30|nr:hypothetical protein [Lysinibacillus sphaericus]